MSSSPRRVPATFFYLAYPTSVVFLGLLPVEGRALVALALCAGVGFVAYATYELTNLSVIRGFSVTLAILDIAWGTLATGLAGGAAFSLVTRRRHAGYLVNAVHPARHAARLMAHAPTVTRPAIAMR